MRVCLLASGSKGNAIYLESGDTRLLIDAGLSAKEMGARLETIGVDGQQVSALLVTHEHSDHSRGVGVASRRFGLPVYLHAQTHLALPNLGRIDEIRPLQAGEVFQVDGMQVEAFPLTHDAVAPLGFAVETSEGKIGVATDLGIATRLVKDRLKDCRVLILESNHDEEMLRDGPYPWNLKQRVRSNHGHLSNADASKLLRELVWEGLEAVFLAHLSEVNNSPDLAMSSAKSVLNAQSVCDPILVVGSQGQPSFCFEG